MKKFKSKILIFALALVLPLASLLFASAQPKEYALAKLSDVNKSDHTPFVVSDFNSGEHEFTKELFGVGADTEQYYGIEATSSGADKICSKNVSGNGIGVNVTGTSFTWVNVKVFTSFTIPQTLLNASKNGKLSITLSADLNPKYGDEHYFTLKNGSVSKQSEKTKEKSVINKSVTMSGSEITSNTFDVEFIMYRGTGKADTNTQFQIYNPKLIISTTDTVAPTIDFTNIGNTYNNAGTFGRNIQFTVSDNNGSGIQYVKFNGQTYESVNGSIADNTSYNFDANYNQSYTIEVADNVNNIYKYLVSADNQPLKSVSISDFASVIHNSQVTFSVSHEMKELYLSSPEKIFYKILSLSEYNELNGNLNLDLSCNTLKTGSNTINLAEIMSDDKLTNGTSYKFLVQAIDEAGNKSNVYVHEFEYDAQKYTITLPDQNNADEKLVGGRITKVIIGDDTFYDVYSSDEDLNTYKTTFDLYYKDRLCIEYEAFENYEFYDLIIDGSYINYYGNSDYASRYDNLYSKQKSISIKFRYKTEVGVDSTFTYSYENDNVYNQLLNSITLNNSNNSDLQLEKIWFAIFDNNNNLCKAYNCDLGEINGDLSNVGNYTFSWGIVDEFAKDFVKNSNDLTLRIIPFEITGITYLGYSNLSYTGDSQTLTFDLSTSNLSEIEKENLLNKLKFSYYLISDTNKENEFAYMLNAGEYLAVLNSLDANYTVELNEILNCITISKQDLNVILNTTAYKYNESEISLDYTFNNLSDGNQKSTVTFEKLEEDNYVSSTFINAGEYRYTVVLNSEYENNYSILNPTGICRIEKVNVYFTVNTLEYDYTGTNIDVDFEILDSENDQTIVSKNNAIFVVVLDDNDAKTDTQIIEVGTYKIAFETNDTNYILQNSDTPIVITVNKTVLRIEVEQEYEYNGSSQSLQYLLFSGNVELLNVIGVDLHIYDANDTEITEFKNVGTYKYEFVCNPKFDIISETSGNFSVVPAVVEIEMENSIEYTENPNNLENLENYNINYTIISTKDTDFTNLGFISYTVLKNDETVAWGNVGNYTLTFTSNDTNVKIKTIDGTEDFVNISIEIVAKKLCAFVENNYMYANSNIALSYEITGLENISDLSASDIILTILDSENNTMFNAGKYYYTLISNNQNYEIVISNVLVEDDKNYVIVNKKDVNITNATKEFTYNSQELDVNVEIENVFDEVVDFEYEITKEGIIVASIVDAGNYTVRVISKNNNYNIVDNCLQVVVNPKNVSVIINNETFEYSGNNNFVSYTIFDEDNELDIDSKVYYYLDNIQTDNTINAGLYTFKILLNNSNYKVSDTMGELKVLPKTLIVKAEQNQYKTYGEQDEKIKFTVEGLVDKDTANDVSNIQLIRAISEDVGLYYISYVEGSNTNTNYTVNFAENTYVYEIVAKKVLVIANKQTKYFGESDPIITFKAYLSGVMCNENDIPFAGALSRVSGENVGSYDIEIGSLEAKNYSITFVKNTFEILQKDLYVTIENVNTIYGSVVELSYTIVGDFDSSSITGNIARDSGNNVGEYRIHKGTLSSTNYNLIVTNGVYKISPKDVYVVADATTKVYGEKDNFGTLQNPGYMCSGLIDGDTLYGAISRELGENVGVYKFTIGTLNNDNYNIIFESANFCITKANVKIIYESKSQVYGEPAKKLTYVVEGLKLNDTKDIFNIHCFREGGDDVGVYTISGSHTQNENYNVEEFVFGTYTIEKAKVVPTLVSKKVTYNGKPYSLTADNFDYPLQFVYKCNGFVVDECVNAGTYSVTAEFLGNKNYYPAKSKEATLIIEKQFVFISVTNNEFIFDDTIKYPTFSYDKNIGIDEHSFTFKFENDIFPKDVGSYNYAIIIDDENFEGVTQGTVKIEKAFSSTNNMSSILECSDATFDSNIRNVKLVQDTNTKKFNNEKVLSVCSLENIDSLEKKDYVYTVKVKATQGVENVKVYKVGVNGFTEQAIKIEDGYYVFKIDDPNDKYIITTEIKTLSTLAWIVILVGVVLIFGIALIIVAKKKHKKQKVSKVSKKDIETYNVN